MSDIDLSHSKQYKSVKDKEITFKILEDTLPRVQVTSILYQLVSFEDLKRYSVLEVRQKDGDNGLSDPAMGQTGNGPCGTCKKIICEGHSGHIVFAVPIPPKIYIREIIRILNIQCNSCGGLILSDSDIKNSGILQYSGLSRWKLLEERSLSKLCHRAVKKETKCVRNPNYAQKASEKQGFITYYLDNPKNLVRMRTAEILRMFNRLSEHDLETLGQVYGHPRNIIMQGMSVLEPRSRPASEINDVTYPHPLTQFYTNILKYNNELKSLQLKPKMDQTVYDLALENLTNTVNNFIDNSEKDSKKNNRPMDGIKQKLGGKGGYIRRNAHGKRVDYAGRSVLTPDPNLAFGQISIPRSWRDILTPLERVNRYNIIYLSDLLLQGEIISITRYDKKIRMDKDRKTKWTLQYGDMVDRLLRDGDYIAWNRQPTLHKESFMGYEVVLWDNDTIGIHLSYTTPTNSDFDGDEGNVHIPRSYETQAELREILNVKRNILSTEDNGTTMGIVYDVLLGLTLLTMDNPTISIAHFNDYILKLSNTSSLPTLSKRLAKYGVHPQSGRALFSSMLPIDFYYKSGEVVIREGILINGYLKKSHIGTSRNSIVQIIAKKYGQDRASDFLTDTSFVVNDWLTEYGFSVGYSDLSIMEKGINFCEKESLEQYAKVKVLLDSTNMNFDNIIEKDKAEKNIIAKLNEVRDLGIKRVTETLPPENRLGIMVDAGSKGSTANIAQIVSLLGQQTIEGQRPKPDMRRGTGTKEEMVCTTYDLGSDDPESRGFCSSSFKKGLTPREYYIHLLTGREALLATSTQIPKVGALNHRNIRSLEDLIVTQDGSVRNSQGRMYQIMYGEDGFSPAQLQIIKGPNNEDITSFIDIDGTFTSINSQFGFD